MVSQVELFLCPDKQGTPEEDQRIQKPKHGEKNNKDKDNSPKTLTDRKIRLYLPWNRLVNLFRFLERLTVKKYLIFDG